MSCVVAYCCFTDPIYAIIALILYAGLGLLFLVLAFPFIHKIFVSPHILQCTVAKLCACYIHYKLGSWRVYAYAHSIQFEQNDAYYSFDT